MKLAGVPPAGFSCAIPDKNKTNLAKTPLFPCFRQGTRQRFGTQRSQANDLFGESEKRLVRQRTQNDTVNYGVATITGYVGGAPTVLVIPSYINSFPVKAIGEGAFSRETVIRTVVICNGIEIISGFSGCNSITDIRIPKSVKTIGSRCFENCGFVNYTIPDGITTIGYKAFADCEKLTNITIPNSVTSIGDGAFV